MSRTRWVWLAVLLCGPLAEGKHATKPAPTPLDDVSVSTLVREAERLYSVGRYRDAALLLEHAHSREPNPIFVFNIARAWEQQGDLDKALEFYQRYLSIPDDTEPSLLKRASLSVDRIRALHSKAEQERKAREAEEKAHESKMRAEAYDRARKEQEQAEARRRAEVEEAEQSIQRVRIFSYVAAGVAGAGLASGVVLALASHTSASDGQPDVARTQLILAGVGLGVGAAALVTSLLIYPRSQPPPPEQKAERPTVRFHLSPLGAGAEVRF